MGFRKFHRVRLFPVCLIVGMVSWSGILYGLYMWAATAEREHFTETIKLKAESLANHTQVLRRWIGGHGGVYVEVDDTIKPHPLLSNFPERDIETPSGRKLTLLNSPAVLSRISPFFERDQGDRVHLVSDHPMNPSNKPDSWEKIALEELEAGAARADKFVHLGTEKLYRLMYPMALTPKCLNCHHYPSSVPNRVVGGLSVTVDKTPYDRLSENVLREIRMGYLSIWIVGLLALAAFDFVGVRLLRQIEFSATHDGLTALFNRKEIERGLNLECERAGRLGGHLSVIMLDIDHFKKVNDTYGHPAGDEALRVVSGVIRRTIRKTDIAGRYGGEEFIILVPGVSCDGAQKLAERLGAAIKAAPIPVNENRTITVTVSIGISCFSSEKNSLESLVKGADEALYQAKEAGRDRVCIAESDSAGSTRTVIRGG